MLKRLNKVLPELILGILIYGILVQITGVWLVEDKVLYSTGLWIGIALAIGMAIHMAVVIEDAVSLGSGQGKIITMSLLRYIVVVLVFGVTMYFHLGDPIVTFIGVMGLKIAAYVQPFFHKVILKLQGREENPIDNRMEEKHEEDKEVRA